ncbi:protein PET117 homolog, mitochondrial [Drosophila virilis]|uniref:Protein PET117 homolog, mitochondrial n=1 Tax=Drosophila virilis TaxID=7244 RepID=B4LU49_DROVI|nr:uncharacterized protein LOC6628637 [Drosophila virilis]EDW64036.1 uncharacterized protein Dvir_GJ24677 [Drosophila virilis]
MSLAAKVTLSLAVCVSSAIIGYVHYKQSDDRYKLHQGVLRDVEQQQRRKHENRYNLQQQIDMTKQLKSARDKETEANEDEPDDESNESQKATAAAAAAAAAMDAVLPAAVLQTPL